MLTFRWAHYYGCFWWGVLVLGILCYPFFLLLPITCTFKLIFFNKFVLRLLKFIHEHFFFCSLWLFPRGYYKWRYMSAGSYTHKAAWAVRVWEQRIWTAVWSVYSRLLGIQRESTWRMQRLASFFNCSLRFINQVFYAPILDGNCVLLSQQQILFCSNTSQLPNPRWWPNTKKCTCAFLICL